jgi:copper transport protein
MIRSAQRLDTQSGVRRRWWLLSRFGVVVGMAFAAVLVMASPAFAHATLESSDPAPSAVLATAPRHVTLHYDQSVGVSLGGVRVFDAAGQRLSVGTPHHPGGTDSVVQVGLPHLVRGSYVVTWRVISADSHPVQGAFTFQVGRVASTPRQQLANLSGRLLSNQSGSTAVGVAYGVDRFVVFGSLIVLIGGAACVVLIWPQGRRSRRAQRLVWAGWVAAVVATVAGIGLEGVYGAALPLTDMVRPDLWRSVLDTRFGHTAEFRLALLAVAFVLLRMLLSRQPAAEYPLPRWWSYVAGGVAVGLAFTPGLAGHASTGMLPALAIPADALHVLAVSVWLGGLAVLVVALLATAPIAEERAAVPRFSQLALACVVVIVATGIFQAWRQVGTFSALQSTDYGHLLLIKLAFVVAILLAAAGSRRILHEWLYGEVKEHAFVGAGASVDAAPARDPAFTAPNERSDLPPHQDLDDEGVTRDDYERWRLRRQVAVEAVIAVAILVVTSLLVNARPARSIAQGPADVTLRGQGLLVDVLAIPGRAGPNDLHIYVEDASGAPASLPPLGQLNSPQELTLQLSLPAKQVAPITVPVRRAGPGHYLAFGTNIPIPGTWQLTVRALRSPTDEVALAGNLTLA